MISLTGMITGSGRVNLLSGQIWRYRVGFGSATQCTPTNLLGHSVGRLGRARVEAGWAAVNSAQKPILN
ncbi:hypothetical protein, partial [Shewanella sp.]|uniref:hypothetical protein n=1 Tax=Shewanella sp. TaxID=50422 RepID=UPI003D14EC2F